jgi:phosphatidyl-myo-inositol dimannoside synthase
VIIGLFPGLASVGGIQLAGRQTAAALAAIAQDRGWSCRFLSLNDARGEHQECVAQIHFRFTGFARRKGAFLFNALRFAREKPRVIFAAHPNLAPIAATMKALSENARMIVGAHGIEIWELLPAVRRKALCGADIAIAPSSDTAHRLASVQGVPEAKIRTLPWPLDTEFAGFAQCADQLPTPAKFPKGLLVLSVGRWAASERYKGADLLIHAVPMLAPDFPDLHLVLVGSGDDLPRLKHLARDSGKEGSIHFIAGLSRKELAACFAACDIFALPSTGEGFGLVFLEAMAFGKPVIGTKFGGIPDLVENDREGLLVEPTAEAISLALRRLLTNRSFREELGARGRERVNREFTFESFQRRLLAIVNEVC